MSTVYDGIAGLGSLSGLSAVQRMDALARAQQGADGAEESGKAGESVFGQIFSSMIQNVKDTDAEFTQTQYLLATGQLDNPAQVGIAAYKNEIAVSLLVQMRNKALDAYNELKNNEGKNAESGVDGT